MSREQDGGRRDGLQYRRLARDADRRVLAGVCTGLGRHTGIDPVVFRVGFAILVLAHGQGIFLYVAAVLLMPARPERSSIVEQLLKRWFDAGAVLTVLGVLMTAGVAFSVFGTAVTDTIALLVVFGLSLLIAHSRGVDLVALARSVPERFAGHPPDPSAARTHAESGGVTLTKDAPSTRSGGLPEGMIDLAAYSAAHTASPLDEETADTDLRPAGTGGATVARRARGGSPVGTITLLAAMAAGAAMIPVAQDYAAPDSWLIVMAPALAVVGCGLVLGGWFRTQGLAAAGTVLTLTMLTASVAGDAPRDAEYGEIEWRPTDVSRTNQVYKVGVGQGDLDLTALRLVAGQRVAIDAEVVLGELAIVVPATARVHVDARLAIGDLNIERRMTGGPRAKVVQTLEPESGPGGDPPVISLRIRGKVGEVSVRRG
ncbi:phage shock protein C (PspC) family protein [Actinomadura pelletieri DSM 43383]|uniref:Phage shock protein C (PspC) family protein n=1 Tax=Actinomadura pelletieri DSM 43383 TaxID=1120940 RepID=A0A495QRU4_9ACTN|nr:PspC domain-containing protein [Actinomadura pelletieri]RKS76206.1 phage shock protein C (PspC) family protein [Actinomadura pelletieri DSM 43383]